MQSQVNLAYEPFGYVGKIEIMFRVFESGPISRYPRLHRAFHATLEFGHCGMGSAEPLNHNQSLRP